MVTNTSVLYAKPTAAHFESLLSLQSECPNIIWEPSWAQIPSQTQIFFFVTCLQSNEYFIYFHFILFIHVDGGKLFNLDRIIINSPPLVQGAGDAFFSKRIDQVIESENWLKEVFIFFVLFVFIII